MERLTSLLFLTLLLCLILTYTECLSAKKDSLAVKVHNFDRQRRSIESEPVKRRLTRQTGSVSEEITNACESRRSTVTGLLNTSQDLREKFVRETELNGDDKSNLQLAWTGDDFEKVMIITSGGSAVSVYIGDEGLTTLQNRTSEFKDVLNDKEVIIVKHPTDSKIVFVVATSASLVSSMFVTVDGTKSFKPADISFLISGIIFHPTKSDLVLATDDRNKELFLSTDSGINWRRIKTGVFDVKWSTNKDLDIYALTNNDTTSFFGMMLSSGLGVLEKYNVEQKSWSTLISDIHSFGMESKFLYCSKYTSRTSRDERSLMVSTDEGRTWNQARVPTITPDRFYSIVDSSDGRIMLHVDNPGDTGHGTLYISDATGIVFSESLRHHLYPNFEDITDFYKVQSLNGTYLTNVIDDDNNIQSVITYNSGAEWRSIPRPQDKTPCEDETKECTLQISNQYSIKRGVKSRPPLSIPNAPGIILAHGHVAQSAQKDDPDVFVSTDGGYSWTFALEGPHDYQIGNHGGFLVAVPINTPNPETVMFSVDAGHCWIEHKFTNETFEYTGLLVEPRNRDMIVAIWGYTTDRRWHTFVLNFTAIIDKECKNDDFEAYKARDHNGKNACILGSSASTTRVKANSWCYIGRSFRPSTSKTICECTKEDYYCDYGYRRRVQDDTCEKDSSVVEDELNICHRGHEEKRVFVGYHKIPEDVCVGGYEPPTSNIVNISQECTDNYVKGGAVIDKDKNSGTGRVVMLGVLALGIIILIIVMTTFVARKYKIYRKTKTTFRYSSIRCEDADDFDDVALDALRKNTSLYDNTSEESNDDDDQINVPPKCAAAKKGAGASSQQSGQVPNGRLPNIAPFNDQAMVSNIPKLNGDVSQGLNNRGKTPSVEAAVQGSQSGPSNVPAAGGGAASKSTAPSAAVGVAKSSKTSNKGLLIDTDDELLH